MHLRSALQLSMFLCFVFIPKKKSYFRTCKSIKTKGVYVPYSYRTYTLVYEDVHTFLPEISQWHSFKIVFCSEATFYIRKFLLQIFGKEYPCSDKKDFNFGTLMSFKSGKECSNSCLKSCR